MRQTGLNANALSGLADRQQYQKIILNTPVTTNSPIRKIIRITHSRIFINFPFFGKFRLSIGKY
ncbi:hypothetical protein SDC9_121520 [bioreactor metagenome]|uniref:Uncharacterized protein n=1 Tax=bioreactor metagenome TaxID=1076179 RepID=A0A645CCC8_9ZZZZ